MALARETKVGLVVAASFLSLVGVVVAARLRNSQEPQTQVAETKVTPKRSATQAENKDAKKGRRTPSGADEGKNLNATSGPGEPPALPATVTGAQAPASPNNDPALVPVLPAPPETPAAAANGQPALQVPSKTDEEMNKHLRALAQKGPEGKEPSPLPAQEAPPIAPPVAPPVAQPGAPSAPQPGTNAGALVIGPASAPPGNTVSPLLPPGSAANPPAATTLKDNGNNLVTPTHPGSPMGDPAAPPPIPAPSAGQVTPPTTTVNPPPTGNSGTNPLAPSPMLIAPAVSTSPGLATPPPIPNGTPNPMAPLPSGPSVANQGPVPPPNNPLGPTNPPATNPNPGTPIAPSPIVPASSASQVKVIDYDAKKYHCTEQDKSFADVSGVVYGHEKYGKALWLFNRDYPGTGDNLRQDPPRFLPGQVVHWPPLEVLQARYPGDVNDPGPRATATSPAPGARPGPAPAAAPVITVGQPMPLVATPGNPNAAALPPAQNFATADNVKMYRVRDGGEHILQIAQTTLGDRNRWPEIVRLNPSLDPRYPVPSGIEIRVPAARP